MALSPEERHRIYLEEKDRLEAIEELSKGGKTKKSGKGKWALIIFALLFVWAAVMPKKENITSGSGTHREQHLTLPDLDVEWYKSGLDNIMMANFTIHNKNAFAIKDIVIKCVHAARSGTHIDSNEKTIYEIVKSKSKKVVKDFNMGFIHSQAVSTACRVSHVERA